jgi:integrase
MRDGIFTWRAYRRYLDCCCRFSRWARAQFGLRFLKDVTEDMGRAFLKSLLEHAQDGHGFSPRTVRLYRAALRKLERGVLKQFGARVKIVPDDFRLPPCRFVDRRAGSYDQQEVRAILAEVRPPEGDVLKLQLLLGLRVSEAVRLRVADVDPAAPAVRVKGKGGLVRYVPAPPEALPLLRSLTQGRMPEQKLFPSVKPASVQRKLLQACQTLGIPSRGTHGFRHTYARMQYSALVSMGLSDREARKEVSFRLGHRRVAITYAYVPPMLRPWRRSSAYEGPEHEGMPREEECPS